MRAHAPSAPAWVCAITVALSASAFAAQAPEPQATQRRDALAALLTRAGDYVSRYGESFRDLVAEEDYQQRAVTLPQLGEDVISHVRSDVVFARLAGPMPWVTFRDVYWADGFEVRDRTRRLERLFASPSEASRQQAEALLRESARYDLGSRYNLDPCRATHAPMAALFFLLPENQSHLRFEMRKSRRTIAGVETVELSFEEHARPTLVQVGVGDAPASGRFWIDPVSGAVLATEIRYDIEGRDRAGAGGWDTVETEYGREPGVEILVPKSTSNLFRSARLEISGRASYARYRRCDVPSDSPVVHAGRPRTEIAGNVRNGPDAPVDASGLAALLAKAGEYVTRYGESFRNLVAEEDYNQRGVVSSLLGESATTHVRSDVVFVRLPGPIPWVTFRDVYWVDGSKVRDRTQRLERLFTQPSVGSRQQAEAILRESSRYNLGPYRDANAPTVALLFLLPENQSRLSFERRKGRRTIAGFETVEVFFAEHARPTLVRNGAIGDAPASGRLWIDPVRGAVLATEIRYALEGRDRVVAKGWDGGRIEVETEYGREPGLDIFVPKAMRDLARTASINVSGSATYANYRRFEVASNWEVTGAAPVP